MNEQPQADNVQMFREALAEVAKVFVGQQEAANYLIFLLLTWHFLEMDDPVRAVERFRQLVLSDISQWLTNQPYRDDTFMSAERILGLVTDGVVQGVAKGHSKPAGRRFVRNADLLTPREWVKVLMARTRENVTRGRA